MKWRVWFSCVGLLLLVAILGQMFSWGPLLIVLASMTLGVMLGTWSGGRFSSWLRR